MAKRNSAANDNLPGPPAFPDMQNLDRNTAQPDEGMFDMDAVECVCVEKCYYQNELVKPGDTRFIKGEIPPHFKAK